MSEPARMQVVLARRPSTDLLQRLQDFSSLRAITLDSYRDLVETGALDQCIILGRRNGRNDTSYYLLSLAGELLNIYESQRGIGPRAWRRFETIVNFLQDNFGDQIPLNDICIIIDQLYNHP